MIQSKIEGKPRDDHVYFDISFYNNSNRNIPCQLFENRNIPILDRQKDYHLAVVRFTIDTSYTPIFIWPKLPNGLPDNNYYSVTIRNVATNTYYQVYLQYVPQNSQNVYDETYLYVYSYQQMLDMINVALNTAWVNAGSFVGTAPPYIVLNPVTGLFQIVAQYAYSNRAVVEVFFNIYLNNFFDNFDCIRYGGGSPFGADILILIKNNGNNDYLGHPPNYPVALANDSYIITQEFNSSYNWNDVRKFVFVSNNMSVRSENTTIQTTQTNSTNSNKLSIITDFAPNIQNALTSLNSLRAPQQFYNIGEYRRIDLTSDLALSTIDLQIFFQTSDTSLHVLNIPPEGYINCKILFEHKNIKGGFQ